MIFEKKLIRFTLWDFIVVVGNAVRIIFVCIWKLLFWSLSCSRKVIIALLIQAKVTLL